jgi:hypothetical protein
VHRGSGAVRGGAGSGGFDRGWRGLVLAGADRGRRGLVLAIEMVWLGMAVEVSALAGAGRRGGCVRCGRRHGRARCAICGRRCEAEASVGRRCSGDI